MKFYRTADQFTAEQADAIMLYVSPRVHIERLRGLDGRGLPMFLEALEAAAPEDDLGCRKAVLAFDLYSPEFKATLE